MAAALRKALPIAQRAQRCGGYKSTGLASSGLASSGLYPPSTPTSSQACSTPTASGPSSTSSPAMATSKSFFDAVKDRRSIYQLNKEAPVSDKRIVEIVNTLVPHVPSAFNSQTTRLVVLLNKDHEKFWDFVSETLKPNVPEAQWPTTEKKLGGFQGAYGTILFFEDPEPVDDLRKRIPIFAQHYGDWAEQSNAMHQFALWVALEAEGFGANLQHYNPIVDQKVQQHYEIPLQWRLRGQLVFGGKAGEASVKKFEPLEKRVFVHGAKE